MSKEQEHCENCGGFETKPEGECNKCKGSFGTLIPGEGEIEDAFDGAGIDINSEKEKIFQITKQFPTIWLPAKEYAYIMSQIATFMPENQKHKPVVRMAIGNCWYTFENHGFGLYRIFDIKFID